MEKTSECKECNTWEQYMYWDHFNSFHFLLPLPSNFHQHLMLPEKFASHMKARLPEKVSLKGPSGASWEIELQNSNDVLFVGNGWKDFVKAHNLNENCLLMFKFKKNSSFKVLIFDKGSLCEREGAYFIKKCNHTKSGHEDQRLNAGEISRTEIIEDDEEDSIIFISEKLIVDDGPEVFSGGKVSTQNPRKHELSPDSREREQPKKLIADHEPEPCFGERINTENRRKKALSPSSRVQDQPSPSVIRREYSRRGRSKKQVIVNSSHEMVSKSASTEKRASKEDMSNRRRVTEREKDGVFQRAIQKETETSFTVVMRPSVVYHGFVLNIPAHWLCKHPLYANQEVVLRVGEKTWVTRFFAYVNRRGMGRFQVGWKRFALDNNLNEFDVLVFTPVSQKEDEATVVLDVAIFRVVSRTISPLPVVT